MKLLPNRSTIDDPEIPKDNFCKRKEESHQRKRKVSPASLLTTSFKMGVIAASGRQRKRRKAYNDALVKESLSALVAMYKALDEKTGISGGDSTDQHSSPDEFCSFPFRLDERLAEKKAFSESIDSLHEVCRKFPKNKEQVTTALEVDPEAVMRRSDALASTSSYSFPLNIALKNKASAEVLQLLIDAAPSVVTINDGHDNSTSLNIALRYRPQDIAVVKMLAIANSLAIAVTDSRLNYPIHVACACGAPLEVVNLLYLLYPQASYKRNIHGETALDIATRSKKCPATVLEFLSNVSRKQC